MGTSPAYFLLVPSSALKVYAFRMSFLHGVFVKIGLVLSGLLISIASTISPVHIETTSLTSTTTESAIVASSTTPAKEHPSVITTPVATVTQKKTEMPSTVSNIKASATTQTVSSITVPSTNPSALCFPIKQQWNTFASALSTLESKWASVLSLTAQTGNEPKTPAAFFSYDYNRFTANQSKFNSGISDVGKLIDALPQPPGGGISELQTIKDAYTNASQDFQDYYSTALQAFKIIGSDSSTVSLNNLNSSQSLFDDAVVTYNKINPSLSAVPTMISKLENALHQPDSNGCVFTFYSGTRTIAATIPDELTFIQSTPTVATAQDYSQATVSLKTKLPVEITDNGSSKKVMQLSCTISLTPEISDVQRVDQNTVQVILPPIRTSDTNRHCKFTYTGSGDKIYTQEFSFSI